MTDRSPEHPSCWGAVRLTTEHFVLDTHLSETQYERLHTPHPDDLLPCISLPETTLRIRFSPDQRTVLILPHCVIARSLILQTHRSIHPPIDPQFEESRRTRALTVFNKPRRSPRALPTIPTSVTTADFVLQRIRLLTPQVRLDAQIPVYRGWTSHSPKDWIRYDQHAVISLAAIHLQTRAEEHGHPTASVRLNQCDLARLDLLHASSCPAA